MYAMRHVDESSVKIASLGGIEVILTAMKEHKSHEEIQRYGCGALSSLAINGRKRRECMWESMCVSFPLLVTSRTFEEVNNIEVC